MFGVLLMPTSRDLHSIWDHTTRPPNVPFNSSATLNPTHALAAGSQAHQQPYNQRGRRRSGQHVRNTHATDSHRANIHPPTALQALRADEELFSRRKENIRKFGAGWLRPPGIPKTLQAGLDEAAERLEQEALARREEGARGMREAQERLEREQHLQQMIQDAEQGEVEMAMDHDLDDEVPDAERISWGPHDDAAIMDDFEGPTNAEHIEHDLDDDVPEAGSYQHTDTELEDGTTLDDSSVYPSTRNMTVVQDMAFGAERSERFAHAWLNGPRPSDPGNLRSSLDGLNAGSLLQSESSVVLSSPTPAGGRRADGSGHGSRQPR